LLGMLMEQLVTGAIFHLSLPATDLAETERFYCTLLGAVRGRGTAEWIDLILFGHQVTFHQRPEQVVPVDRQGVEHFGAILPWPAWEALCENLEVSGHPLELDPTVFAAGSEAEHAKVVLRDPSGHMLEFKAYRNPTTVLPGNTPNYSSKPTPLRGAA
jgi:extradiol dioxygenase family protein